MDEGKLDKRKLGGLYRRVWDPMSGGHEAWDLETRLSIGEPWRQRVDNHLGPSKDSPRRKRADQVTINVIQKARFKGFY